MANIILKDKNGVNKVYTGVEKICVPASDGSIVEFTQGSGSGSGESGSGDNLIDELISGTITNITTNVEIIRDSAFTSCYNLEEVNAPNCIEVNANVLTGCSSMISFNAPLIEYIGPYAFSECEMLGELYFPNANCLEESAFVACFSLSTITLGNVDYLSSFAFGYCYSLTDVYLGYDGVVSTDWHAFGYKQDGSDGPSFVRVHVRSECADQYTNATNWSDFIDNGFVEIVGDYED